jgi:hypothetical protein
MTVNRPIGERAMRDYLTTSEVILLLTLLALVGWVLIEVLAAVVFGLHFILL